MLQDGEGCRQATSEWVASGQATRAPEVSSGSNGLLSAAGYHDKYTRMGQITWTSPVSDRLLLEAGLSSFSNIWGFLEPPGAIRNLVPVVEQSALDGMPAGLIYRGLGLTQSNLQNPNVWRATASYVTGSNGLKIGYQGGYHVSNTESTGDQTSLEYQLNRGVPNRLTMFIRDWDTSDKTRYDALYVQDQWTVNRVTLQGALRYDHAYSWHPAEGNGSLTPQRFYPVPYVFPDTDGVLNGPLTGKHTMFPEGGVTVAELRRLLEEAGRVPVERDTLYHQVMRTSQSWSIAQPLPVLMT